MSKRGKKAILVDRYALTKAIEDAEKDGPLRNQKELWEIACELYNKKALGPTISHSIVQLRAREWKLEIKTKSAKGRRGPMSPEHRASFLAARGKRTSRKDKFKNDPEIQEHFKLLRERTPVRFHQIIDLVEEGSRTASQKLKCLDCSNFQTAEIRRCEIKACPQWAFRPYQGKTEDDEDVQEAEVVDMPYTD